VLNGVRLNVKYIVAKQFADWFQEGQLIRHIDGDKQNNALSNLYVRSREEDTRDRASHKHVIYEYIPELPPGYKPFTQYKDWKFNGYFTDGINMINKVSEVKYRVLHAVKTRHSDVFNLHDTNHVNRGITRVRLLKQVKADEK
jgi:hypothetical protein